MSIRRWRSPRTPLYGGPLIVQPSSPLAVGLVGVYLGPDRAWWGNGAISLAPIGAPTTQYTTITGGLGLVASASSDVLFNAALSPVVGASESMTVHALVVTPTANATRKRVVRLAGATFGSIFAIDNGNGSVANWFSSIQDSGGGFPNVQGSILANGTPYALTAVHDVPATTLSQYVNGVSDGTPVTAIARREAISQEYLANSSATFPFLGVVAAVFVWRRALSAAEIAALVPSANLVMGNALFTTLWTANARAYMRPPAVSATRLSRLTLLGAG